MLSSVFNYSLIFRLDLVRCSHYGWSGDGRALDCYVAGSTVNRSSSLLLRKITIFSHVVASDTSLTLKILIHQTSKNFTNLATEMCLYMDRIRSQLQLEILPSKYWKVELMGREDEAGRGEDGQMISRTGQTDQWQSVQGWRGTGNNGDCWCTK